VLSAEFDDRLREAFADLPGVEVGGGRTVLTATVRDDSDFYGLIARLEGFGLRITSMQPGPDAERGAS
jgi:hypothetical protein